MSRPVPVSVVETPEFLAATRRIMDDEERGLLVDYLARNPLAGDLISWNRRRAKATLGLGGTRQVGRRAVVYYYHSDAMPIFALTAYAKNERADQPSRPPIFAT